MRGTPRDRGPEALASGNRMADFLARSEQPRGAVWSNRTACPKLDFSTASSHSAAMTALLLDTLRLSRSLRDKGNFTSEQAEALAEALSEASQGDLASKADFAPVRTEIADFKTELKTEITDVRSDLKTAIAELRTGLKAEIAELRTELKDEIAGSRAEVKTEITGAATELKTEIAGLRTELKTEIAELRTELKFEIAQAKTGLLKWILGAIGFLSIVILGALISLFIIIPKQIFD